MGNSALIISLPRAGSTMLQRLMIHNFRVAAPAEPWMVLPVLWNRLGVSSLAGYDVRSCGRAIDRLEAELGSDMYYEAARKFYESYMARIMRNSGMPFAIDKTPRYSCLGLEITKAIPDVKKILLWRDPCEIACSMIGTWGKGKPVLEKYKVDYVLGTRGFADILQWDQNVILIRYDELCADPTGIMKKLEEFLEVERRSRDLSIELGGKIAGFGDPVGQFRWDRVENRTGSATAAKMGPISLLEVKRFIRLCDSRYLSIGPVDRDALRRVRLDWLSLPTEMYRYSRNRLENIFQLRALFRRSEIKPRITLG